MIERIIHFVWVGKVIPEYGIKNAKTFKMLNPSFDIDIVHIADVNKIHDNCILNVWQQVNGKEGMYSQQILYYKSLGRSLCQTLSNILRLDLLNRLGGVYVDFDCIPVKPFSVELLSSQFVVARQYLPSVWRRDCYFIGKPKDHHDVASYMDPYFNEIRDPGISLLQKTQLKSKMKNGQSIQVDSKFYIAHANMEEWKKW